MGYLRAALLTAGQRAAITLGARSIPGHVERASTALGKAPWPPELEVLIRDRPRLLPAPGDALAGTAAGVTASAPPAARTAGLDRAALSRGCA